MKTLLLLTLLIGSSAAAQESSTIDPIWHVGARGGFNFSAMTIDPPPSNDAVERWVGGSAFGIEAGVQPWQRFGLNAQLLYTSRNSQTTGTTAVGNSNFEYFSNVRLKYVDLPVTIEWLPFSGDVQPYGFIGTQFSYLLEASHEVIVVFTQRDTNMTEQMNRIELSVLAGAGIKLALSDRITALLDGSFIIGLTDVNNTYTFGGESYLGKSREFRAMAGIRYRL